MESYQGKSKADKAAGRISTRLLSKRNKALSPCHGDSGEVSVRSCWTREQIEVTNLLVAGFQKGAWVFRYAVYGSGSPI
jgi:hypothetical protein